MACGLTSGWRVTIDIGKKSGVYSPQAATPEAQAGKQVTFQQTFGERLEALRAQMKVHNISAYIVPTSDDHQSESVQEADKRRQFISGFTGSAGVAVVTADKALLWTDSRYYIQAKKEIDSNLWVLMKDCSKESPKIEKWFCDNLPKGSRVGVDPRKFSVELWTLFAQSMEKGDLTLVGILPNLVDEIWLNKPPYSSERLFVYPVIHAGESHETKVEKLRKKLTDLKADTIVLYRLDEIAWLFNLRGNDVQFNPIFRAYVIVTISDVLFFVNEEKLNPQIKQHLQMINAHVYEYDHFWESLKQVSAASNKVLLPCSRSFGPSYYMKTFIPVDKCENVTSPVMEMKSYKNQVELEGMRKAQIRESIVICELIFQMTNEIISQVAWSEKKVGERLSELRSHQILNYGDSFTTISAFGPNSALPHYTPTNQTNLAVNSTAPLTIDTGGQYMDGTTDTTRVLHFGKPSKAEIEVYTALLKGVIDLATTVFPEGTKAHKLDFIIRRPLYKVGRSYGHGSTHGTGIFLNVHEDFNGTYRENFIGSQEPGFYKEGDFGMRLENLVAVVPTNIPNFTNERLMTFETLTLVPYEKKLISPKDMEPSQILWLNNYHTLIRDKVGNEMIRQGKHDLYRWLVIQTEPIQI